MYTNSKLDYSDRREAKRLGGPGSGHHGHAGRPGKRGGSAPRSSGGYRDLSFREIEPGENPLAYDEKELRHSNEAMLQLISDSGSRKFHNQVAEWEGFDPDVSDRRWKEREALISWRSSGYHYINKYLRGELDESSLSSYRSIRDIKRDIRNLDLAFNEAPRLPYGIVVRRGLDPESEAAKKILSTDPKDLIGKVFQAKAFISTSISKSVAKLYATPSHKKGEIPNIVTFTIKVPAGEKFIAIPGAQSEILLNRNLSFEVEDFSIVPARDVIEHNFVLKVAQKLDIQLSEDDPFAKSKAMKLADAIVKLLVKKLGGPGSGFHGHAGRPGKRGGSAP